MPLDDMILAEAERARDRMETAQDDVERARGEYHRAIRRLHAAGGTLREIAEALGLSHQRVHQVVDSGSMIEPERPEPTDLIQCTFCKTSQKRTRKLIAGPGVYICEICVAAARAVGTGGTPDSARAEVVAVPETSGSTRCSFCGKSRKKIDWMISGTLADERICDECVALCIDILTEER